MTNYSVMVDLEPYPEDLDPRDWDNIGVMACWHNRYTLGDIQPKETPDEWLEANAPDNSIVLPLFLIDHSGISMQTSSFHDSWDSGQVGWIVATPEVLEREYGPNYDPEHIREVLRGEVETYDQYLRGEIYYWAVLEDDTIVESCSGYFGEDAARAEGEATRDYLIRRANTERLERLKTLIRNHVPLEKRARILEATR